MGNKRIYIGRESSKYAKIAGGAIITITSLFFVLMAMGFEITGTDDVCLGTPEDPCVSYGKICNLGPNNYDIYNPDEVKMDFSPNIPNSWMFFKDGRVKKQFLYEQGINASTRGWRYENFTNATKPRKDRIYVHRFARYSCQDYMLVGLKENPDDLIKWGVGVGNEYLDPVWYGENESAATTSITGNFSVELGRQVNITANLSGANSTCVDIDHPEYGDEYVCGSPFLFNISYFRKTTFNDSSIIKGLTYAAAGNQTIYVSAHQYDEVVNLSLNLTGALNGATYPEGVKIYINDTLSNTIGPLRPDPSTVITIDEFNGSDMFCAAPPGTCTKYFKIPKEATVVYGTFNYTGLTDYGTGYVIGLDASAEARTCDESTCTVGVDPNEDPDYYFDGNNATYAVSVGGTGTSTTYTMEFDWNLTGPAKVQFQTLYDVTSVSGGYRRVYFQCYDYFDSAWSTYETRTYTSASGNIVRYHDTTNDLRPGCFKTSPFKVKMVATHIGVSSSVIRVYELNPSTLATGMRWYNATTFPQNSTIEVGAVDGTWEGNQSGEINISNSYMSDDFNDTVASFLSTCTVDSDGYCLVPLYLTGDGLGKFYVTDIVVNYTYNPNPIYLALDAIRNFLNSSTGFVDIPITIYSAGAGIVNVSDIKYDYRGGNDTISVAIYKNESGVTKTTLPTLSAENMSFSIDSNVTRNITLYKDVVITEAFMNMSSFLANNFTIGVEDNTPDATGFLNVSAGALFVNIPQCYDGFTVTRGGIDTVGVGLGGTTAPLYGYVYENYTIPSGMTDANTTFKFRIANQQACLSAFTYYCKSESDGSWTTLYTYSGDNENAQTLTYVVSDACMDETIVMVRQYLYVRDPTGSSSCDAGDVMRSEYYDGFITWYENTSYVTNPELYVGDTVVWDFTDEFNGTHSPNRTANFSSTLNSALNSGACDCVGCTLDGYYCTINFTFHSDTAGILEYDDVDISYGDFMNRSLNDSMNIFVYFSNFIKELPYTWTTKMFFIPPTNNSKNVTAYGQTSTTPTYNITTTNYGGDMNMSIKVNESFSCLNISWNATGNTKPTNQKVNTTWQEIATDLEYLNNTQIWFWADFDNCNASNQKILRPEIYLQSYCKECVWF